MKRRLTSECLLLALFAILLHGCAVEPRVLDLRYAPRLGPEDAPVEIVVFSDFQCAFCRKAAAELKRINKQRPGRVKIYYKHFPLSYHAQAKNAAIAAEAARLQGKFWQMHDLLFAYANELHDGIYRQLAGKISLDLEKFDRDFKSFETRNRVYADRAEGESLGVDYTPYFFVDQVPFRRSYSALAEYISERRR
jgi:protein-disulfide isomerase